VVQKGSNVCCTLMCGGIWITGSKFGVTWKLSQCAVKPPETFKKGKCYIPGISAGPASGLAAATQDSTYGSDGEDEVPETNVIPTPTPSPEAAETVVETVVEPVVELTKEQTADPAPEPVPEPVKKVSKKKAGASV